MKLSSFIPFLLALSSVNPVSALPSSHVCKKVEKVVTALQLTQATPFCSSFLGIKPVTKTATVKQTVAVPGPTVTATVTTATSTITKLVTSSKTVTSAITRTRTQTATATVTATITAQPLGRRELEDAVEKREPGPALPWYLQPFGSAAVSTACSCLNIPTPTKIITSTQTISSIGPAQTRTVRKAGFVTVTQVVTVAVTRVITATATRTLTRTLTTTAVVTP